MIVIQQRRKIMNDNYKLEFDDIRLLKEKILEDLKEARDILLSSKNNGGITDEDRKKRYLKSNFFWLKYTEEHKALMLDNFRRKFALLYNEMIDDEVNKGSKGEILLSNSLGYFIPLDKSEFTHGRNFIRGRALDELNRVNKLDKISNAKGW